MKIKIAVLEIAHTKGQVISGGDKVFEGMSPYLSPRISVCVIIPQIAAWHWRKRKVEIIPLPKNLLDDYFNLMAVFLVYLHRIITATKILLALDNNTVIYSSTNIFPDIIPAYIAKTKNQKIFWFARIHHVIPPPQHRPGNFFVNVISYTISEISLKCIRKADKIGILSSMLIPLLVKKGFDKSRLVVLPVGIETQRWQTVKRNKKFDAIFLGRLHPSKGINDLIPLWSKVCKKLPKAKLVVVGQGSAEIIEKLKKKAQKAGIYRNIMLIGPVSEKRLSQFLLNSRIFLFLDHEAGFGIAPLEAMAAGLPIVGYDLGLLGNVFKKGFVVIRPFDLDLMSNALITLISNPQKLRDLSNQAKSEARTHLWPTIAHSFQKEVLGFYLNP